MTDPDRDEKGRWSAGNRFAGHSPGRRPAEVAEAVAQLYRDIWDEPTRQAFLVSMRKKIAKADMSAVPHVTERTAGKVADKLDVEGQMRIIVEYLDQTTHTANQDSAE